MPTIPYGNRGAYSTLHRGIAEPYAPTVDNYTIYAHCSGHSPQQLLVPKLLTMATYAHTVYVAITTIVELATAIHPLVAPCMVPTCPVGSLPGCHTT